MTEILLPKIHLDHIVHVHKDHRTDELYVVHYHLKVLLKYLVEMSEGFHLDVESMFYLVLQFLVLKVINF